jgi:hypothetical protein
MPPVPIRIALAPAAAATDVVEKYRSAPVSKL